MNKLVLNSILGITMQKDSDSLHRAFLSALMAVYELKESVFYKVVCLKAGPILEQVLRLKNSDDLKEDEPTMDEAVIVLKMNDEIRCCYSKKNVVVYKCDHSVRMLIPVTDKGKVCSIIMLDAENINDEVQDEVKYLSSVYENFYSIINESEKDKLTDLYNRRTFDSKMNRMLEMQIMEKKAHLSTGIKRRNYDADAKAWLAVLDIDFFKQVNDIYGHVAGDEVLLRMSQIMKESLRHADLLFRFGGEEFVIVLEPITYDKAMMVFERLQENIRQYEFPFAGKVTVSIGITGVNKTDYHVTILDYADKALYYAKEHGRDQICCYEQLVEAGQLTGTVTGDIDLF